MNIVEIKQFGDIEAIKLGYGPIGPPFMSVYLYVLDGIVIDTGRVQKLTDTGMNRKAVFKRMDDRQDKWVKPMTMGNLSFANMLRSACQSDGNE
jgi:hypothetical protein